MATPTFSAKLPDVALHQLDELTKLYGIGKTQVVIRAIADLHRREFRPVTEKNLTDNAWVYRVNELRQMVTDLDQTVTSNEEIDWLLESPDFFGDREAFDQADKTVLRREMQRQYGIK